MTGPSAIASNGAGPATKGSSSAQPGTNGGDPALSLRAAALLTLKSKRKKHIGDSEKLTTSHIPTRPRTPARSTIQLDYGQEETPKPQHVVTMDVDKNQAREEGEISDSEAASKLPAPKKSPKKVDPVTKPRDVLPPKPAAAKTENPVFVKAEPISPRLRAPIPATPPRQERQMSSGSGGAPPALIVDEDHVRPGLASSLLCIIFLHGLIFSLSEPTSI